ncbi:MAG: hypothetical protein AAGB04_06625 [Pseudomonadota bacterium]
MSAYQTSRNAEQELLKTLKAANGLKVMGCQFYRGLVGGIGVTVSNRALGIWRYDGVCFKFSPHAGEGAVTITASVDDALESTIAIATSSFLGEYRH